MNMHRKTIFLCLLLALPAAAPLPAAAQAEILRIDWELSRLQGKERAPYAPVTELRLVPDAKFTDHLRALVTLRNPAARPVEGLVLRYAVRLRLLRKGDSPEKAFWGVPFYTEEVRVSKIAPGAERKARLIHLDLSEQLRKLRNTGFLPEAVKLEVMVAPRQGDEPAAIVREAVLGVARP